MKQIIPIILGILLISLCSVIYLGESKLYYETSLFVFILCFGIYVGLIYLFYSILLKAQEELK